MHRKDNIPRYQVNRFIVRAHAVMQKDFDWIKIGPPDQDG